MKVTVVIPARLRSTRLPEKVLSDIHGKPLIQYVYERAEQTNADEIIVATDHQRIADVVESFGGTAMITPESLTSGTDRVAFVAKALEESDPKDVADIFVNIQGDEPSIDPETVNKAIDMVKSWKYSMATAAAPFQSAELLNDPNAVKVLVDKKDRAVYFSRLSIPYSRVSAEHSSSLAPLHHMGIYVYSRTALLEYAGLPKSKWEEAESLEQLRALENGIPIGVVKVDRATRGVDTAEDLEQARLELK